MFLGNPCGFDRTKTNFLKIYDFSIPENQPVLDITVDRRAAPLGYMKDQPNIRQHKYDFFELLDAYEAAVIDQTQRLMDGTNETTESSLEKLRNEWIDTSMSLTYNKDASLDNHFERPIQVSLTCIVKNFSTESSLFIWKSQITLFEFL